MAFVMQNFSTLVVRLKAATIHAGLSMMIGAAAAFLVFGLWYPWPYRVISGGQSLFILIVSVDLVLGPALTFVVFNRNKPKFLLMRDLMVIAALQLGGLVYGLHTVYQVRPIAMVYEPGRFRVVTNVDVVRDESPKALPEYQTLPLMGPRLLGTREPLKGQEAEDAIFSALSGADIGQRPVFWEPYAKSADRIVKRAWPVHLLYKQYPSAEQDIKNRIGQAGRHPEDVKFLPIVAKDPTWSVLIDGKTAEILGYVPYSGFF
jgi:hypothetical protein